MEKGPITTHILDLSSGKPAPSVPATLEFSNDLKKWNRLGHARTNSDGRIMNFLPEGASLQPGLYRIRFETKEYFGSQEKETFYPFVEIAFELTSPSEHYHVPLLISPFGYSTYRGS